MKQYWIISIIVGILISMNSCKENQEREKINNLQEIPGHSSLIHQEGENVETRFNLPEGFVRKVYPGNSFENYLRTFPLLSDTARVTYYNGKIKNKSIHAAVLDIDVGNRDLQQCADAVIRLRAEYLYEQKRYSDIHFKFTNGFKAEYIRWAEGNRIQVQGNQANWVKLGGSDYSYQNFKKYIFYVFNYAGTISLSGELKPVEYKNLDIGSVFIQGGSPGHAMIVMDVAENLETGKKIYLLAQSYMPAQSVHIVKNLQNPEISPWFELNENEEKVRTPEWIFKIIDLKKF